MRQLILASLIFLCVARGAAAHDLGASNATFWVRTTGIDVELYMAPSAGALIIADNGDLPVITPDTFSDFKDRLQAAGSTLFTLTTADGTALRPDAVAVSMTDQTDILYNLHYPLPAAMPGTLKIHAAYMDKMVETHLATFYVMNTAGDRFGYGEVRPDAPDIQAHLPAADSLIPKHSAADAAVAPAPARSSGESQNRTPWFLWVLLGGGLFVIALLARRGMASSATNSPLQ